MVPVKRHPIFIWLILALFTGEMGCATGRHTLSSQPPSEEVRANLGTIGVVAGRFLQEAQFEGPTSGKGSGAGKGAAMGFLGMIGAGLQSGSGYGLAAGLALAPVAGLVGAVYGAVAAEPEAKVEEAEAAIKKALADLKIQETMRDRVLQVAQERTRHRFVMLPEQGVTAPGEEISYRSFASEGIDTILEIHVLSHGLADGGINPPLALIMTARARLIRAVDGTVLYDSTFEHRGGSRKFTEWAVNNAQPLLEELDRGYEVLAQRIVEDLFLLMPIR